MSALQLEYYWDAARRGLSKAIVTGPAATVFRTVLREGIENGGRTVQNLGRSNSLGRTEIFLARIAEDYPDQGEFLLRVKARAELTEDQGYRRPVTAGEVGPYLKFFDQARSRVPTFEEAIRETLAMVLVSPDFLYLMEPAGDQKRSLTQHEIAARLSYFLWSSMPDEKLFSAAERGVLNDPDELKSVSAEMLQDPRSWQFVDQFVDQWLAGHYGLNGPQGMDFQRMTLPSDSLRGGLLSQTSLLMGNPTGEDSHPVKRAVWIRQRLLDDPPADAPAKACVKKRRSFQTIGVEFPASGSSIRHLRFCSTPQVVTAYSLAATTGRGDLRCQRGPGNTYFPCF